MAVAARWTEIGPMSHPAAYVRRMIVTTFLADRRKVRRRQTYPTDETRVLDTGVAAGTAAVDTRLMLDRTLRMLPTQQRAAVVLRYYLDLDDETAAEHLGISPSGVRSNISRALVRLRVHPDLTNLEQDL
ncbi:hypothetical protein D1871_07905 [Nakamurella silvestris]|nr:hypothetical protein D1871_07905 [Nakamurella silvestris]